MAPREDEDGEAGEFLNADLHGSLPRPSSSQSQTNETGGDEEEGEGAVQAILRQSSHPTVAIFHILFKVTAISSYLLLGLFTKSFVIQFVTTVTLLAFDFWTVKNVTGRLLVGLRWWHEVGDDGMSQKWRFETIPDRENLNVTDGRIFWWTMYITPIIWVLLGAVCIVKFNVSYLLIVVIALMLSGANIVGYYKCNKDATEQIRSYIGKTMLGHVMDRSGLGRLSSFV